MVQLNLELYPEAPETYLDNLREILNDVKIIRDQDQGCGGNLSFQETAASMKRECFYLVDKIEQMLLAARQ